jgi:hypothetical protein
MEFIMTTLDLRIKVTDELLMQAGLESLKAHLEKAAENFQLELLAPKIKEMVGNDDKIDADFQEAKTQAWEEYKHKYLPKHLVEVVRHNEKIK